MCSLDENAAFVDEASQPTQIADQEDVRDV